MVQIWYVGEGGIELTVVQTLRSLSDDTTPIDVDPAQGVPVTLALDIEPDPLYLEADVLAAVGAVLLAPHTDLLTPERIGIGTPLYRSRIFEAAMGVAGVQSVRAILWEGSPFADFALQPDAGTYFDLEAGSLMLNGTEASGG